MRRCDAEGCNEPGEYRAPKSRSDLTQFYYFCLDHVREYNRAWNYFEGMSDDEIEDSIREDTTWQRPTWPLGNAKSAAFARASHYGPKDGFGVFRDGTPEDDFRAAEQEKRLKPEERRALRTLDLPLPVDIETVKTRYKELAKQLHPDVNGGDPAAEEKLKLVNQAYTVLKNSTILKITVNERGEYRARASA
ncbi:MAG: J domain-containing protein [Pseudomonadota bacterium]